MFATDGVHKLSVVQILAIWMRFLMQQLQFVLQSQGRELSVERTLWVMTVPSVSRGSAYLPHGLKLCVLLYKPT